MSMQRKSREEMREGFKKRMQENQNKQEGGYYSPLFRKDITIPFMKCGEGYHTIDILDYIAGKNDQCPGEPNYCYEFYYYSNVGAGQGPILALGKTFGLPDPIAEVFAKRQRDGADKDTLKSLSPARNPRVIYNVICCDSKEEEAKGVQVFHTSSYLMEDYLREMAKGCIRPGMEGLNPLIDFTDPVDGKSIKFKREGTTENTKFILHQFVDRPKGFVIPESLLSKVFTLDELIYIPSYEEVQIYYYGKGDHQPSERSLRNDSRQEEEKPKEERKSRFDNQPADVPEKVAEEKAAETKPEEKASNPCPSGHLYGKEIDKFPKDCEPCPEWKNCARAARENIALETTSNKEEVKAPEKTPEQEAPSGETRRRRRA
jgi:hypothetical protein